MVGSGRVGGRRGYRARRKVLLPTSGLLGELVPNSPLAGARAPTVLERRCWPTSGAQPAERLWYPLSSTNRALTLKYTPRTIALLCELHHPAEKPDPRPVQEIHNATFQQGQPPWSSFAITPTGPVLSNPATRPGASSVVRFLPDRIQFREELSAWTYETFADQVLFIAEQMHAVRGTALFTGQQVTIRTLVNPKAFKDAREFLKAGMFQFDDQVEDFAREPKLYGLRMVFPPTPEEQQAYSLRVESYNHDTRSLFLEIQGTFGPCLPQNGLESIRDNILATYGFLVSRGLRFVSRFDASQEA